MFAFSRGCQSKGDKASMLATVNKRDYADLSSLCPTERDNQEDTLL